MVWDTETQVLRSYAKFKSCKKFFLSLKIMKNHVWTKSLTLKLSATVYDPLGLIPLSLLKPIQIFKTCRRSKIQIRTTKSLMNLLNVGLTG